MAVKLRSNIVHGVKGGVSSTVQGSADIGGEALYSVKESLKEGIDGAKGIRMERDRENQ